MKVRKYLLSFFGITYRKIVKPIFFLQDPEKVHIKTVKLGEFLGNHKSISKPIESVFNVKNKNLSQKIHEINFVYKATLPQPIDLSIFISDNGNDGYCYVKADDFGKHEIRPKVIKEFLKNKRTFIHLINCE